MASAAVVHTIAQQCAVNKTNFRHCGCDRSLKNEALAAGEKWGGCSPDIHFSIGFAKMFVDKTVSNDTLQQQTFVLHNNRIGRMVSKHVYEGNILCSHCLVCLQTIQCTKYVNVYSLLFSYSATTRC